MNQGVLFISNSINDTRINACLESFTIFSRTIFRRCLTFDAVYISFNFMLFAHSSRNKTNKKLVKINNGREEAQSEPRPNRK